MKIQKEKALLQIGYKTYKVHKSLDWVLSKTQMLSILKNTDNNDFLFKRISHFDGQIDGTVYDKEDYETLNDELKNWIIEKIKQFDFNICYNDKENIFEFYSYTQHFHLKPTSKLPILLIPIGATNE